MEYKSPPPTQNLTGLPFVFFMPFYIVLLFLILIAQMYNVNILFNIMLTGH